MASAAFSINNDSGSAGFEATNGQVLTLRLRQPLGAHSVIFQVWDPAGANPALGIAANPPRASKGAPALTLTGSSSGHAVAPAPDGTVTLTMPGGAHSYLVRCVVNGGTKVVGGKVVSDPTLISHRGIFTLTGYGTRKPVATESSEFEAEGWAGALADHVEAGVAGMPADLVGIIDGEAIAWAATQTFNGSVVLGTVQYEAAASSPVAVTLGANVTSLFIFGGDVEIASISGHTKGRVLFVHLVSAGTKRFTGSFYRPGNVDAVFGAGDSFWLIGNDDGAAWIVSETVPRFVPPATGALVRTVSSRLMDDVHVADFMTPAQIADANNGTKLFDLQPAIQAAVDWLLFGSLGVSGSVRGRLRVPAGILRIDRPIHINYGLAYRTLLFEGEGILRAGEHAQTGTAIVTTFGDAPAIAVTAGLDVIIKQMSIVGINSEHIADTINAGPISMSHLDPSAWVDPGLPASASSRYAPYAAIAIDPYSGPQPVVHYPDVEFPAGMEATPQYDKPPSTQVTIEDVRIDGFVVGIVVQPGDYDGSGDFMHFTRVQIWWCTYGISWGNSQARSTSITDCTFAFCHTAIATSVHGKRIGMPQFAVLNCSFMTGIQVFEVNNLGYGLGPTFISCFSEAMYRLGVCNGQSKDSCGLTFRSCEWGFTWWDRYGVPTWVLEMMGGHQVIFDTTFFYNTAAARGYLGFRCSGSGLLAEPARQLQFIGCQTIAPETGANLAERCAQNGTLGIAISLGNTSMDRFSITNGYLTNLDDNTDGPFPILHTEQTVAPRQYCAPVYAKKLKSLINGNDPGIDVAWRNRTIAITTVVSTVGRVVTFTSAGATAASLAHSGGDVGDVLVYSGQGAAFIVKSRTGTTLVMEAATGFDMDGELLTPVEAGGSGLYAINCRRYVPSVVLYGDITSGSPVIENIVMGSGAAPNLDAQFETGDFIFVDDEVDKIIEPADATLVTIDNVGKELTFGGNFLLTRARMRLGVFVRAAMPNA